MHTSICCKRPFFEYSLMTEESQSLLSSPGMCSWGRVRILLNDLCDSSVMQYAATVEEMLEPSVDSKPVRQSPACTSAAPDRTCALLLSLAPLTQPCAHRGPYPRLRPPSLSLSFFLVFFPPSQCSHCCWVLFLVLFLRASCVSRLLRFCPCCLPLQAFVCCFICLY